TRFSRDWSSDVCSSDLPDRLRPRTGGRPHLPQPRAPADGGGPRMSDAAIEMRGLVKRFGGGRSLFGREASVVHAVRGVTLALARGETLGIVGESGSGKSTLARMLVGLERPTEGTMVIDGQDWDDLARAGNRAFGRTIQYVFQDPVASLNPRKTVSDVLDVPLKQLRGYDRPRRQARK